MAVIGRGCRAADGRFVLPHPVARAHVLSGGDGWSEALRTAGVTVTEGVIVPNRNVDLVVAAASDVDTALAAQPAAVMVIGRAPRRRFEATGYHVEYVLSRPGPEGPRLLAPLSQSAALRYVFSRWAVPGQRALRWRNRVLAVVVPWGIVPSSSLITVAARRPGPPYLIEAATSIGLSQTAGWFLALGEGDELQRATFHLFAPGAAVPSSVLKFARVPEYDDPFVRDERGLTLAQQAGPVTAARAPRLLGRFVVDGLHAAVETAGTGSAFDQVLQGPTARARKQKLVEDVAAWIVDMGRETASDPASLDAERRRLEEEVLIAWRSQGARPGLAAGLPAVAGVLAHNDLGTWNISIDRDRFTVLDWESARRPALPLWDLVYFLTDALVTLDGPASVDARVDRALRLLRGESRSSPVLFGWIRKAVDVQALPSEAVGALVTLGWLHHGLSHRARHHAVALTGAAARVPGHLEQLAPHWLADPRLGPGWDRWQA